MKNLLKWLAAITLVTAYNLLRLGGMNTMPLALSVVDEEEDINKQLLRALGKIDERVGKINDIEAQVKKQTQDFDTITKLVGEVQQGLLDVRKLQLEARSHRPRRHGEISDDCARHLGGLVLCAGLRQERLSTALAQKAEAEIKRYLGIHAKTALSSSDIPLPEAFSGEVAELVYEYGIARKIGTVYPLGAGVTKLPRLKTDVAFTLLAAATAVTEKSPQTEFITFTAEKFGGMVRLPSEIDEDSIVAMGQFLARYAARNMAAIEDYQFFRSTGAGSAANGTAKGLTKLAVDNSIKIDQTSTKTKQSDMTLQNLRDLRSGSGVSGAALARACYMVHPSYEAAFVAFNTSATVTPYQRGAGLNGATLDGFPIVWVPSMPAYSTSASASLCHVLFGDPSFMYLGVRGGYRFDTSREAAFDTDEILVRAIERFTVGLMATAAVGGLVTAAS